MKTFLPLDMALAQEQAAVFNLPGVRLLGVTVRMLADGGVALEARVLVGKRTIKLTVSAQDIRTAWGLLSERMGEFLATRGS